MWMLFINALPHCMHMLSAPLAVILWEPINKTE